MEATFQEELKAQREEEMTIAVPDDIDGPRDIAEWYQRTREFSASILRKRHEHIA